MVLDEQIQGIPGKVSIDVSFSWNFCKNKRYDYKKYYHIFGGKSRFWVGMTIAKKIQDDEPHLIIHNSEKLKSF